MTVSNRRGYTLFDTPRSIVQRTRAPDVGRHRRPRPHNYAGNIGSEVDDDVDRMEGWWTEDLQLTYAY